MAARAPADGYTIFQNTITQAVNVTLYRKLPYSLMRDFAPVTQLANGPAMLVVHPSLPVRNVHDLIRLARAKPGAISYASGGTGTYTFLAAELFKGQAGVNMLHVPYRGGGAALSAVISGEAPVYFSPLATAMPNVREGRLRALATTLLTRIPLTPDVPTIAESGLPGYQSGNWYGLLVPAKTSPEIIAAIRAAAVNALSSGATHKRLLDLGYITVGSEPAEFAKYMASEVERLGKIVRALHLTAE
jgi:tripartite-type tricarboxylate transporter receptor subunit TctC